MTTIARAAITIVKGPTTVPAPLNAAVASGPTSAAAIVDTTRTLPAPTLASRPKRTRAPRSRTNHLRMPPSCGHSLSVTPKPTQHSKADPPQRRMTNSAVMNELSNQDAAKTKIDISVQIASQSNALAGCPNAMVAYRYTSSIITNAAAAATAAALAK